MKTLKIIFAAATLVAAGVFISSSIDGDRSFSASAQTVTVRKKPHSITHKTYRGGKTVVRKTYRGTKTVARETVHGTKYATRKTVQGTRWTAHKTKRGTKRTFSAVKKAL